MSFKFKMRKKIRVKIQVKMKMKVKIKKIYQSKIIIKQNQKATFERKRYLKKKGTEDI